MATSEIDITITQRPANKGEVTITQATLGQSPYLLVQVEQGEDGNMHVAIETGGGVPQDEEAIGHLLTLVRGALGPDEETEPAAQ